MDERSTDSELAVLAQWREGVNTILHEIHAQTKRTNGRVTELEVKERIRQDREEQKAIRDAAAEAAKYRIEQQERDEREREEAAAKEEREHDEAEREHDEQVQLTRNTWRMMRIAAAIGAAPGALIEAGRLVFGGHL